MHFENRNLLLTINQEFTKKANIGRKPNRGEYWFASGRLKRKKKMF